MPTYGKVIFEKMDDLVEFIAKLVNECRVSFTVRYWDGVWTLTFD